MPTTIFWDVDTQVDFMDPQGKLYVPGAEQIIINLGRLTCWASGQKTLVVSSACAHRAGDAEFELYPPHCLLGTPGQQKIPQTQLRNPLVIPNRPVEIPPNLRDYGQIVIEKQQFDVFTNPNTEALLKRLGKELDIVLYGVVTEICVACAARGLLDRGHRLRVVCDAVHHLDEAKARAFFDEVVRDGGQLMNTDEVLGLRSAAAH